VFSKKPQKMRDARKFSVGISTRFIVKLPQVLLGLLLAWASTIPVIRYQLNRDLKAAPSRE
jgi:hypothetical protein